MKLRELDLFVLTDGYIHEENLSFFAFKRNESLIYNYQQQTLPGNERICFKHKKNFRVLLVSFSKDQFRRIEFSEHDIGYGKYRECDHCI